MAIVTRTRRQQYPRHRFSLGVGSTSSSFLFFLLLTTAFTLCSWTVHAEHDTTATSNTVTFLVMGDVPYTDMERCSLPFEMEKLVPEDGTFLIHLGDIRSGKPDPETGLPFICERSVFEGLSDILAQAPMTAFAIPGDNGWLDCANEEEAFRWWEEYLFHLNERNATFWPKFPSAVHRWSDFPADGVRTTSRPELFSFLLKKVLIVGHSLPGPRNEESWLGRDSLVEDNISWLVDNLNAYDDYFDAVVLLTHAAGYEENRKFMEKLTHIAKMKHFQQRPILILEDEHSFEVNIGASGASNIMKIKTDDTVTPMSIIVDTAEKHLSDIFQYDRRCPCTTNHNPTQIIEHESDRCATQCSLAHAECKDEDRCKPGADRQLCLSRMRTQS